MMAGSGVENEIGEIFNVFSSKKKEDDVSDTKTIILELEKVNSNLETLIEMFKNNKPN